MDVSRRALLAGGGGGLAASAAAGSYWLAARDVVDHAVIVTSDRETAHDVIVATDFDGEAAVHGPRTLTADDHWTTTRFDSRGELTVHFDVDGETVREDVHELPTVDRSRSSFTMLELLPDDEIRYGVWVEE